MNFRFNSFVKNFLCSSVFLGLIGLAFGAQESPVADSSKTGVSFLAPEERWANLSAEEQAYRLAVASVWQDSYVKNLNITREMDEALCDFSARWGSIWIMRNWLNAPLFYLNLELKKLCILNFDLSPEDMIKRGARRRQVLREIDELKRSMDIDKNCWHLDEQNISIMSDWVAAEDYFTKKFGSLPTSFVIPELKFTEPLAPHEKVRVPVLKGHFNVWLYLDRLKRAGLDPASIIAKQASFGCPEALAFLGFEEQAAQNGHKALCLKQGDYWFERLTNGVVGKNDLLAAYYWYDKILKQPIRYINYDNELKIKSHVGALLPVHPEDLKCYTKAAYNMGVLCLSRICVPLHEANDESALKYFRLAASFNYTPAVWATVNLSLALASVPECNIGRCRANFRYGLYLIRSFMRNASNVNKVRLQRACVMLIELSKYFNSYVPYTTTYFDKISNLAKGILGKEDLCAPELLLKVREQIESILSPKIVKTKVFDDKCDDLSEKEPIGVVADEQMSHVVNSSPECEAIRCAKLIAQKASEAESVVQSILLSQPSQASLCQFVAEPVLISKKTKDKRDEPAHVDFCHDVQREAREVFVLGKRLFEKREYDHAYVEIKQALALGYSPKASEIKLLTVACYKSKRFDEALLWAEKLGDEKLKIWFKAICLFLDESRGEARFDEALALFEQLFPTAGADFSQNDLFDFDEVCSILRLKIDNIRVLALLIRICISLDLKSVCDVDVDYLIGSFYKFAIGQEAGYAKLMAAFLEYQKSPNMCSVDGLYKLIQTGGMETYLINDAVGLLKKIANPLVDFFNRDLFESISLDIVKTINMEASICACYFLSMFYSSGDELTAAHFFAAAEHGSFVSYTKELCKVDCLSPIFDRARLALLSMAGKSGDDQVIISAICHSDFFRFMAYKFDVDVAEADYTQVLSMIPDICVVGKKGSAKKNIKNIIFANMLNMCVSVGQELKKDKQELIGILRKANALCGNKGKRVLYTLSFVLVCGEPSEREIVEALSILEGLRKYSDGFASDLLGCLYSPSMSCGGFVMLSRKDIKRSLEYWREATRYGCPAPRNRFFEHVSSRCAFFEEEELVEDFVASTNSEFVVLKLRIAIISKIITSFKYISVSEVRAYCEKVLKLVGKIRSMKHTNMDELEIKASAILEAALLYKSFRNYSAVAKMLNWYLDLTGNIFLNADDQVEFEKLMSELIIQSEQNVELRDLLSKINGRIYS